LLAGFVDVFRDFAAVNHLLQLPNQMAASTWAISKSREKTVVIYF
jgi:hypothetical protein